MIAAIIPFFVITLCNISHVVLAAFFFPSIVEFLDDLHWGFTHRSWYIEYMDDTLVEWGVKGYMNHSKDSILTDKATHYERSCDRPDIVKYDGEMSNDFDEYLRFRENRIMLQQAADDGMLIRKQNFRSRIHERMIEQAETKTLARIGS